jgi:hypothetical protein
MSVTSHLWRHYVPVAYRDETVCLRCWDLIVARRDSGYYQARHSSSEISNFDKPVIWSFWKFARVLLSLLRVLSSKSFLSKPYYPIAAYALLM